MLDFILFYYIYKFCEINYLSLSLYIVVHVDMYSDDDFSLKNNCLSNISNIDLNTG